MSSSDFKVGDKVWVKTDINNPSVEELATIVKLPSTNNTKYDTKDKYNNKEQHHNDGNNNSTTTISNSISDKPKEIAVKSEATVSSNLTEYSE